MENKSKNIIFYMIISILIFIIIVLGGYIIYDKLLNSKNYSTSNSINENNNQINNNSVLDSDKNQNINDISSEKEYIRNKEVVLVEEPNCTGLHSTSLIASINSNGNIDISQDYSTSEIIVGNAKYLYTVGILACDNVKLYYITDNKELYVIDNPNSYTMNQTGTKVSENKIIEFLGTEVDNVNGKYYLKVLNDKENVEYIKFYTSIDNNKDN